jgi:phage-related protein (TIGR01555 family)
VQAAQESTLRPLLERLVTLLLRSRDGPTGGREPKNWSFQFNPLWQLNELQEAERRHKAAVTDQIYLDQGVVHPAEIRRSRFGGDAYTTETALDPQYDDLEELLRDAVPEGASDGAPSDDHEDGDA